MANLPQNQKIPVQKNNLSSKNPEAENFNIFNTLKQLNNRQIELSRKELASDEPDSVDGAVNMSVHRLRIDSTFGNVTEEDDGKNTVASIKSLHKFTSYETSKEDTDTQNFQKCSNNNLHSHLFFPVADSNMQPPEWFVDCTRQEAEAILMNGHQFGNVLMRKSSSYLTTGKYVISLRREYNGEQKVTHYSVIRSKDGFKIDVRNQHDSMPCLLDVLKFFVSVAGKGTQPFHSCKSSSVKVVSTQ